MQRTFAALAIAAAALAALPAAAQERREAAPAGWDRGDDARHERRARGRASLDAIMADAQRRYPGRVTDVSYDDGEYEIEIRQRDGREVDLEYSARTGRLLDVDYD
ncbi:hypothetical protein LDO32_08860 [Luteimonas sp. Y-2-2-4F]|nr:PepSY domain-containing protein [Luteimonas sp. Y-2-2-4F]MCD9031596.1 hypothetical protein [Luteimonas sp. Y-2-2-4F]MCD9031829.1 hypothetical protein [Luteimonas sp. Y-2-2-4F]